MPAKINFFLKPIQPGHTPDWEIFLIEFSLGVVCTVLADYAWDKQMMIVAAPTALIGITCLGLVLFSLIRYLFFKVMSSGKRAQKRN